MDERFDLARDVSLSPERLARAMADRLDAVMPAPVRVRAEGTVVGIIWPSRAWLGGSAASELVADPADEDEDGTPAADQLTTAAWAILSGVQDQVAEALREPWPPGADGRMAMPAVRVADGVLLLTFERGDAVGEESVMLALEPIPLADLAAS